MSQRLRPTYKHFVYSHVLHCVSSFWQFLGIDFVPTLLDDKVAKNMLYIEALHSVAKGHIDVTMETREKLAAMKSKGQKKEVERSCDYFPSCHVTTLSCYPQPSDTGANEIVTP